MPFKRIRSDPNTSVDVYTHRQTFSATYENGKAKNVNANESYSYDIEGPSGRIKEKKSAGFDGTRAANGKMEGQAWRHKTDGFSDETFNNGFNVGRSLESPFANGDGFGPRRIDNSFGSSRLGTQALGARRPSWALERARPLEDDNSSFRDGFRSALFGTNYGNSTASTSATLGSQPARPLGVAHLREEGVPASYANFTPWREDNFPPSSGPNRMYPSRATSRNNSVFSTASNATLAPRDSASQRPRFS
ncbi:hypothetical protein BJY00DRAFT_318005 [Aspergillus carlsbadensis]|nr:hypothetical protein BJY00DRAFT_318005 [Aspergillus carlsbadensis]